MIYDRDTLFKALDGVTAPYAVPSYRYPVGRWTRHIDPATLAVCKVGYHLARGPEVLPHLVSGLYVAEPCPDHGFADSEDRLLTCRVRVHRITTWNERVARLFAADVAEAVLLGERACGKEPDERSWAVVRAARSFADGLIGVDEMSAAEDPPWMWMAASCTAVAASRPVNIDMRRVCSLAVMAAISAVGYVATDPATAPRSPVVLMFDRLLMYLNDEPLPPVEPLYEPAAERSTR